MWRLRPRAKGWLVFRMHSKKNRSLLCAKNLSFGQPECAPRTSSHDLLVITAHAHCGWPASPSVKCCGIEYEGTVSISCACTRSLSSDFNYGSRVSPQVERVKKRNIMCTARLRYLIFTWFSCSRTDYRSVCSELTGVGTCRQCS